MDEKTKSGSLTVFSLGALLGVLAAVIALLVQRIRRTSPLPAEGDLPDTVRQPIQKSTPNQPMTQSAGTSRAGSPAAIPSISGPPVSRGIGAPAISSPRWSTPTKYIMGVILFLSALVVVIIGRGVIPMVILAALLALFINPFILLLNRRLRLKWPAAVALTYVLVILVLLLIPLLIIPNLSGAVNFLFTQDYRELARQAAQGMASVSALIEGNLVVSTVLKPMLDSLIVALENFTTQAPQPVENVTVTLASVSSQLAGTLGALVDILGPVIAGVVSGIFTLLVALQMSLASNQISSWYPDLIPPAYKGEYAALFQNITGTWVSFLRGQLTLMLVIGVTIWLGNLILGVPSALLLGIIAGLLEMIPSVGPTLAAIPAVLLALFFGSSHLAVSNIVFALLVIGFYVLIQFLENQFLVPYIMGDAVDLPPLIVLIGTVAGASAFGILGALLATPVIATGNLVFQFIYRKILEPPPAPADIDEKPSIWESVKGWVGRLPLPGRKKQAAGGGGPSPRQGSAAPPPVRSDASHPVAAQTSSASMPFDAAETARNAPQSLPPAESTPQQSRLT